jgi:hypothetical protein
MTGAARFPVASLALVCLALALLISSSPARAQAPAENELARKYAPYIALKPQDADCDGDGERFRPVPVDVVLDQPGVTLHGPGGELIKEAPSAADLYGLDGRYTLDLPGDSLDPRCDYEEWFREVAAGVPTTVYAHVVTEPASPGLLALQYWFYWPFNDWNNTHESDWEMVQLIFEAASAEAALDVDPLEIGYSQHEGAERAGWTDQKLEKRGDHPAIHPGTGSHANYFGESLHLGHSPSAGFGCDDTREQTDVQQAEVILLPTRPSGPDDPFAWLGFEGRWGERHHGSFSGPTGPLAKPRWLAPISWRDDAWRDASITVTGQEPGKGLVPLASDVFCSVVESGSKLYVAFLGAPLIVGFCVGAVVAGGVAAGRRTRWRPAVPMPIDKRRRGGQMFTAAARLYTENLGLFVAIGLMFLAFGAAGALVQLLLFSITPLGALVAITDEDPVVGTVAALTSGTLTTVVASVLVYAAAARAIQGLEQGLRLGLMDVYRDVFASIKRLLLVTLRVAAITTLLSLTIVGIPFALLYLVRRSVSNQAVMIEDLEAGDALRRSGQIVRGDELRTSLVASVTNLAVFVAGPIVGILALLIWSPSLFFVNVLSGLIYTLLVPYAGVVLTLLFYDQRRRGDRSAESAGEEFEQGLLGQSAT